jgi:hypothetical protein
MTCLFGTALDTVLLLFTFTSTYRCRDPATLNLHHITQFTRTHTRMDAYFSWTFFVHQSNFSHFTLDFKRAAAAMIRALMGRCI